MADIELVIKMPEDVYKRTVFYREFKDLSDCVTTIKALENGTPLPKQHTELVDRQTIADYVHSHIQEINTGYGDLNQHTNRILRMIEDYIDNAPTIIEADTESEE